MRRWATLFALLIMPSILLADDLELPIRHHPVEVTIPIGMKLPDEMKADEKGRIICSTCHGIDNIEKMARDELDKTTAGFLRGGPYHRLSKFCFRCHEDEKFQRKNIHIQRLKSGEIDKSTCLYCHEIQPDPKSGMALDNSRLRLPPGRICLGCHLKTPHLNAMIHQRKPDDKMRDYLYQAKDGKEDPSAMIHQRRPDNTVRFYLNLTEADQGVRMPLDEEGEITCITCHTPHEKGVIPSEQSGGYQVAESGVKEGMVYSQSNWTPIFAADKEKRLAELSQKQGRPFTLEYQRLDKEVLLRLPAKDGTLCNACHKFED